MANRPFSLILAVAAMSMVAGAAHAQGQAWQVGFSAESGVPGGYVQVRENAIDGTPLHLRTDLGVTHATTLRLSAVHRLGARGALHLSLSGTDLRGATNLTGTAYFNGTTLAPGPISSETGYLDNLWLQAAYWYRATRFGNGGQLWVSGGFTFVSLNFRIGAQIAPSSVGHETKEDFNTQELPIPVFGIHLSYPFTRALSVFAGFTSGHLPWTNSLRREGGMVQLTQTNEDAILGLHYRFTGMWSARIYLYSRRYQQNERSAEDGNYVRINEHGIGLGIVGHF